MDKSDVKYKKYNQMKKMGIPLDAMKQKMTMDGFNEKEVNLYLGIKIIPPPPSESDSDIMTPERIAILEAEFNHKHDAAKTNEKYSSYIRMQKMRIPNGAVRNKMAKVRTTTSINNNSNNTKHILFVRINVI